MRLEVGMLITTNFSGPYRISEIVRDCTCASYLDTLNGEQKSSRRPHIHLTVTRPDGSGRFWLNRWDEDTLLSLDKSYCGQKTQLDYDRIIVLENDRAIQLTLF